METRKDDGRVAGAGESERKRMLEKDQTVRTNERSLIKDPINIKIMCIFIYEYNV